ncbi:MAG: hypothetical protein U1E26_05145 [Coriobacteriia bacterium]|nr:hypothetical protein [Coriobacteriia bacterium]
MLYIEDVHGHDWAYIVRVLAAIEPLDMVAILHQGDGPEVLVSPFGPLLVPEFFVRPPRCCEDAHGTTSRRLSVDEDLLEWLELHDDGLEDMAAAFALYPPRTYEFFGAFFPQERVVVVQDEHGSALAAAGIRLGDEQPHWWE